MVSIIAVSRQSAGIANLAQYLSHFAVEQKIVVTLHPRPMHSKDVVHFDYLNEIRNEWADVYPVGIPAFPFSDPFFRVKNRLLFATFGMWRPNNQQDLAYKGDSLTMDQSNSQRPSVQIEQYFDFMRYFTAK
jgi:hypothetical protein